MDQDVLAEERFGRNVIEKTYTDLYGVDPKKERRRHARELDLEREDGLMTHDSPFWARYSMVERLYDELLNLPPKQTILEVGSGKQILELMMYRLPIQKKYDEFDPTLLEIYNQTQVITIDIADINPISLLGYKPDYKPANTTHLRADGYSLPIAANSLPIVVANFSIDFLPGRIQMFKEVHRVLEEEGGVYIANFHHIRLEENGDGRNMLDNSEYNFMENTPLYASPEEFIQDLSEAGFDPEKISYQVKTSKGKPKVLGNNYDLWWEVRVAK